MQLVLVFHTVQKIDEHLYETLDAQTKHFYQHQDELLLHQLHHSIQSYHF